MNCKGSGRGLLEILSRHFFGGNEENQENPQSGQPVSRPRFRVVWYKLINVSEEPAASIFKVKNHIPKYGNLNTVQNLAALRKARNSLTS
jgi:hypothetical protein